MGPPQRVRYNSRARASTAGGSSHKKRSRSTAVVDESVAGTTADGSSGGDHQMDIVVPKTKEEKEEERKQRLKAELVAASETKMSSKKLKRLDGFIAKKLKKEARVELFGKLQASQASLPTSLLPSLASASTLGSRHLSSHAERAAKAEDLSVRKLLDKQHKKRRLNDSETSGSGSEGEDEDDWESKFGDTGGEAVPLQRYIAEPEDEAETHEEFIQKGRPTSGIDGVMAVETLPATGTVGGALKKVDLGSVVVGGALRKKEDGGASVKVVSMKKAKGKGKMMTFGAWKSLDKKASAPSDSSFDSSDSEMDTDSEDNDDDMSDSDEDDMSDSEDDSDSEENDEESEEEEEMSEEQTTKRKRKATNFKAWAIQQLESTYKQVDESPIDPASLARSQARPAYEEGLNLVSGSALKTPVTDENGQSAVEPLSTDLNTVPPPKKESRPIPSVKIGPLGETLRIPASSLLVRSSNPKNRQLVNRPEELQKKRLELPVVADEQEIMEKILISNVVVLCGETGSGKTTQVPQFLYEAGFGTAGSDNPGMVAVTQPRRVAAMSMAARVASELSLPSSKVSYQIRYDATVSPETAIKFMTDGVLLREIARDLLLTKYSVVIVDEAHERSVNTDVLIGLLSRIVQLRKKRFDEAPEGAKPPPLRLVIMSATLRVTDFTLNTRLFKTPPPTITIPTRQHPVTVHFNRRTPSDYLGEALKKVSKIHTRLPPGGILVFLTGQGEIQTLVKNLEKAYGVKAWEERKRQREKANLKLKERNNWWKEDKKTSKKEDEEAKKDMKLVANNADMEIEDMDFAQERADLAGDVDDGADSDPEALDSDSDSEDEIILNEAESEVPMHILPLYSLLPSDKQMKVFAEPPEGTRLVVVATNVAETSLTIPGIRYVVDCGRAKERHFDPVSGVQAFKVSWISKASASQRAGRAGRTGPGHCYRLYSSPVFENYFEQFAEPEILRMPIEGIVLQMKSMNISAVVNFPFPTPPNRDSLAKAEKILTLLGALDPSTKERSFATITPLGEALSFFPVSPRFSKMLVSGQSHGCLPYVIASVAVLAVGDPFLREAALGNDGEGEDDEDESMAEASAELSHIRSAEIRQKEEQRLKRRSFFQTQAVYNSLGNGASDVFRMLAVVGAYEYDGTGEKFCAKNFIRPKAMQEIHKLRAQISHIAQANLPSASPSSSIQPLFSPKLSPPNSTQLKVLRQLLTSAFIDQVAVRKDILDPSSRSAGAKFESTRGVAYRAMGVDEDVYIHPSSVLFHGEPPEWVVWQDVVRTSKIWIKTVTKMNPAWLPSLSPPQFISYSKPLETPRSISQAKLVGSKEGETRETFVIPRFHMSALASGAGLDSKGVELPPMKRIEIWKGGRWTLK